MKAVHLLSWNLDHEVQVVRHPAVGVCPGAEFRQEFADDALEGFPVCIRLEEWAAIVATEGYMMNFALEAQAGRGLGRHVAMLARRMREVQVANLTIFWGFPA